MAARFESQQQSKNDSNAANASGSREGSKFFRMSTYRPSFPVYSIAWSYRRGDHFRLAIGSFLEEYNNKVTIVQHNDRTGEYTKRTEFDHPYPPTKIAWLPDKSGRSPDLLATSGDYLRLWEVEDGTCRQKAVLTNNKNSDFCAPLTSFDWNDTDVSMIGTASIDTTCTIWNIETGQARTQLIAHDREVFDMAFCKGTDIFASVGADGSLRTFDLRSLEHSTILYESPDLAPLLRLAWNKQDTNYIATFAMDSSRLTLLDIRMPSQAVSELAGHHLPLNTFSWAPHSASHICTAGDDAQALVWDVSASLRKSLADPMLAYKGEGPINQMSWCAVEPDWMAIAYDDRIQTLRV